MQDDVQNVFSFGEEVLKYFSVDNIIAVAVKLGMCFVILIVAAILIKLINKFVKRIIYGHNKFSERKADTLYTVCKSVSKYIIYFFVVCQILSVFGINIMSFIAVAGVGSVAIAFGAQSLVQDIITGMFILFEDQFAVGDLISIEGCSGTVEAIGIRTTRIRSTDGNVFIVPNGQIKVVTNMSKGFNRAIVDISVAYEENIDRVIEVMKDELKHIFEHEKINGLLKEPQVLGVVDLADSAVIIRISADSAIGENWSIEREIRRIIKNRFDKENISIPYPQLVVHTNNEKEV